MTILESSLTKYQPPIEIVTGRELGPLSSDSDNGGFQDYLVKARYERRRNATPQQDPTSPIDDWWTTYQKEKLEEAKTAITSSLPPIEKLLRIYNRELLDISLLFAAGKMGFDEVIPPGITPQSLYMNLSMFQEIGLQVMLQSSLYWKEYNREISPQESQLKAAEIAWLLKLDNHGKNEREYDSADATSNLLGEMFISARKDYHNRKREDAGRESLQIVRTQMSEKPLQIPAQLEGWICKPKIFLRDHHISAKAYYLHQGTDAWLNNRPDNFIAFTGTLESLSVPASR